MDAMLEKVKVPSLHIFGDRDNIRKYCIDLVDVFSGAVVLRHPGGTKQRLLCHRLMPCGDFDGGGAGAACLLAHQHIHVPAVGHSIPRLEGAQLAVLHAFLQTFAEPVQAEQQPQWSQVQSKL